MVYVVCDNKHCKVVASVSAVLQSPVASLSGSQRGLLISNDNNNRLIKSLSCFFRSYCKLQGRFTMYTKQKAIF